MLHRLRVVARAATGQLTELHGPSVVALDPAGTAPGQSQR